MPVRGGAADLVADLTHDDAAHATLVNAINTARCFADLRPIRVGDIRHFPVFAMVCAFLDDLRTGAAL